MPDSRLRNFHFALHGYCSTRNPTGSAELGLRTSIMVDSLVLDRFLRLQDI